MAWDTNPLYALLHEAIYCQGAASNWAAHLIRCDGGERASSRDSVTFHSTPPFPQLPVHTVGDGVVSAASSDAPGRASQGECACRPFAGAPGGRLPCHAPSLQGVGVRV